MIPLVKTILPSPEELMPELERVIYSGYVSQGEIVEVFERKFEDFIGEGYSLSLNSGTAALHIALILSNVGKGDEVISTALTAEPTNVAIKMNGANIRYADIDFETGNISPESIEKNINNKTKAIIVVDYAGIPVDVESIKSISEKYNIPVIHDCAHSLGAKYLGLMTGRHFEFTVFSFQAIKHLTTIDGGVLHIHDKNKYEKAKLIRWFGLDKQKSRLDNNIKFQGFKYHMNNVNAAIGLVQMNNIENIISAHVRNGKYFDEELKNINGVELLKYYKYSEPSYWLYTLKVENRDSFVKKLSESGITASELHKRNDWHEYLKDFESDLPNLDKFYSRMVHIPCGSWLNQQTLEEIVNIIKSGW
jgi:perosamine synthetase